VGFTTGEVRENEFPRLKNFDNSWETSRNVIIHTAHTLIKEFKKINTYIQSVQKKQLHFDLTHIRCAQGQFFAS